MQGGVGPCEEGECGIKAGEEASDAAGGLAGKGGEAAHRHKDGAHPAPKMHEVAPVVVGGPTGEMRHAGRAGGGSRGMAHRCLQEEEGREELCGAWCSKCREGEVGLLAGQFAERPPGRLRKACLRGLVVQHPAKRPMRCTTSPDWREVLFGDVEGGAVLALPRCR